MEGESMAYAVGSPPRVRGIVEADTDFWHKYGITPACAGTSCGERRSLARLQDHPRVCGE